MILLTTLSVVQVAHCRMLGRLLNDKLERMWEKAVAAYFKELTQHSPGGTEENHAQVQA
jgi:hypothetical protein